MGPWQLVRTPIYGSLSLLTPSSRPCSLQNLPFADEQFDYIRVTRVAFALPENRVRMCLSPLVALWGVETDISYAVRYLSGGDFFACNWSWNLY